MKSTAPLRVESLGAGLAPRRPIIRTSLPGPHAAGIIERDRQALSSSHTRPYPLVIRRGRGAWVTDVDGNEFLDFTAGIAVAATGHAHPAVVSAIRKQAEQFVHMSGTDFYYEVQVRLAERLGKLAPIATDNRVFFCNSGTEAVEGALKLARWSTGRPNLLAFWGGFHGRTLGALSLTASKAIHRNRFGPLVPGVFHVSYPSARSGTGSTDETFRQIDTLFSAAAMPDSFAAVFVEPIQGEGGYVVPPDDFLPRLRQLTRRHGILLVADEVQSGMGRTGRMFAVEHWQTQPDIITIGKGIASGVPLAAFAAPAAIMTWPPGAHGNTFGGNPVACAAGLVTLDLLESHLVENAARIGEQLLAGLSQLAIEYPDLICEARGKGLMLALEMMSPGLAAQLIQIAFQRGLLLLPAGAQSVRLSPPLVLTAPEAQCGLEILGRALDDLQGAVDALAIKSA